MTRWFAVVLAAGATMLAAPAHAEDKPPYDDLQSVGGIALCDLSGKAVTGGDVDARPFVWEAVSSVAAPPPYDGPGAAAVLSFVQPVKDTYPDRWNNDALTASTAYDAKTAHPTAVATGHDETLAELLALYPAVWDGYVQLRLHWGARGIGFDDEHHVSVSIKVEGSRWHLVGPSQGDCSKGRGKSTEVTVAGIDPTAAPTPAASTGAVAGTHGPAGSSRAGTRQAGSGTGGGSGSTTAGHRLAAASWGDVLPRLGAVVGAVVVAAGGVSALRRRRAAAG